jgi:hypothetical protein
MYRMKRIRRAAAMLAGLALVWVGLAGAAPAAFAMIPSHGGTDSPPVPAGPATGVARTVVVGGMPGWQIALIAAGAALLAAVLAVLADRARTARRQLTPSAA